MNLWGGIPLIAAALLSGGAGGPATAAHQGGAAIPAVVASPPISIPSGAPAPILRQTGRTWETTVLLSSTSPACGQLQGVDYWLATTRPDGVIQGHATPPTSSAYTDPAGSYGSSCQVMVTFTGLAQVPATATLVIDQTGTSSTVTLAVSRNVTLKDYLAIPAAIGGAVTLLSLLLSVLFVWVYDRRHKKPGSGNRGWLTRPILGSGAWTANDSWATNISTGLVVVNTVLAATGAANSLFPGVSLDRFSLVNITAGFFVAAAPVVFGIVYSQLTARRPGLIADAKVKLPGLQKAAISVPSGASITLAADTEIQDGSAHWAKVRGGGTYQISPGATIQVVAGAPEITQSCYEAAEHAVADVLALAVADATAEAAARASVDPAAPPVQQVVAQTAARAGIYAPAGPLAGGFTDRFERAVEQAVDQARWAAVQAGLQAARRRAGQADGAGVWTGMRALRLAIEQALMRSVIAGAKPPADEITQAITGNGVRAAAEHVVLAAVGAPGREIPPAIVKEQAGKIIEAMKQDLPDILAEVYEAMACSGTADIGILPGSILQFGKWAGTLTIQASDVVARPPSPLAPPEKPEPIAENVQLVQLVPATKPGPSDAPLRQPVFISAGGGAKVTVTGSADLTLPQGTQISAPRERYYKLRKTAPLMVPQGTNVIVANLCIILIVNLFTMFGIGAELGIASVLADFSDATALGHICIFSALAVVAALVVVYAITATRTMADPQPGSSISSQAGTSFTL